MPFNHISIVGVGLLGGSIGLAAKAYATRCQITGYGHRRSTLERALEVGAIDHAADDLPSAVESADLVILCTPVGLFPQILDQIAPHLAKGTVVTDVGSTKRSVVELAQAKLPHTVHFVGSHPMAGSEKRGVEFARTDLFQKALCILTPTAKTHAGSLESVGRFWTSLGMRLTSLAPDEHDRLLAEVSHLPHAVAAALVAMQEDQGLGLCGKGFLDTTRIAGGDGPLWRDIFMDNADNLRSALHRLRQQMVHLEAMLQQKDGDALACWLDRASKRREELFQRKLREMEE